MHFQAAWGLVLTGLVYVVWGVFSRHFRKNLVPAGSDLTWRATYKVIANHLHIKAPSEREAW